jgi:hypothetical protein
MFTFFLSFLQERLTQRVWGPQGQGGALDMAAVVTTGPVW